MLKVILDALIPREDFEVLSDEKALTERGKLKTQTLTINQLEQTNNFFYPSLRKPDFQRETSDWSSKKICEFITCFIEDELVPAIILWESNGLVFVIDGAHRLSALIAWVHDDYGDGFVSKAFFGNSISSDQQKSAEKTRNLIKRKIGSYQEYKEALNKSSEKVDPKMLQKARNLAINSLHLQWVSGDANKAEASFFRINQSATPIDKTEIKLLKSRKKANSVAARAIVRAGTGHKYWSKFPSQTKLDIQNSANKIYQLLFQPELKTPIKTLDLPVAGRGMSAQSLPLILNLVNIVNQLDEDQESEDDQDGFLTLKYLEIVRNTIETLCSSVSNSLGLHPAVYFYSANGRYQQSAFFAVIKFITDLTATKNLQKFTERRKKFEDFLIQNKEFINQIANKHGSGLKSYKQIAAFFWFIFESLSENVTSEQIRNLLKRDSRFSFLNFSLNNDLDEAIGSFSTSAKSEAFIRDALANPMRCKICGGLIHQNGISFDHLQRKSNNGSASPSNAQVTHPYCNSVYKH